MSSGLTGEASSDVLSHLQTPHGISFCRQPTWGADEIHLKLHLALPGRQPGAGAGGEPQSAADKWQKGLQVPHVLFKPLDKSGFITSLDVLKS